MNKKTKKVLNFIASLKVAVVLLILIALYIVIGTLIPQHSGPQFYLDRYETLGPTILALSLDKAYSSLIFIILVILFTINLTLCTVLSLKSQFKQMSDDYYPPFNEKGEVIEEKDEKIVRALFKKRHFKVSGDKELKGAKFRWGVLGATITHIGLIILFLGGTIGNLKSDERNVTLLPTNQHYFEEEGFLLTLEEFYMTFDDDGELKQYISRVNIKDDDGTTLTKELWVNKPLHYKGLKFYQANFGWTGNLRVVDTDKQEIIAEGLLRGGRSYFVEDAHLTILLYGYYPDLAIGHGQQPVTLTNQENNPHFAVVLYQFGQPVDSYIIAPNQAICFENYNITFTHAVAYTGLLVRSDPSYPIVLTSFIVILLGMFVSFYCYPRFVSYEDGKLRTCSRRNQWVFRQSIVSDLNRLKKKD
ncbi:MAG: cytochrome c biogenesis protein ResB [Sphaerochaetaceae bacterium]|jgi:cytochrome c biogenesis protein